MTKLISEIKSNHVKELINPKLVFTNTNIKDQNDIFHMIYDKAKNDKLVLDKFYDAIIERESTYPTGLETEAMGIAIPHTEPEYIRKSFISVITSKEGIDFRRMDNPDQIIKSKIIFLLGLADGKDHVKVLAELMEIFQNKDFLKLLHSTESPEELMLIINQMVGYEEEDEEI